MRIQWRNAESRRVEFVDSQSVQFENHNAAPCLGTNLHNHLAGSFHLSALTA